jgi:hypothetical protein
MKNFTIYLSLLACLFASKLSAQDTFEGKAKEIAERIEAITKEEKEALKQEIESVNKELEAGTITNEQADEKKVMYAEKRSKNIELRVAIEEEKLKELVNQKVDGKIKDNSDYYVSISIPKDSAKVKFKKREKGEKRTTSQFVFAMGVNNLATDGAVANSDFKYMASHFYEWGVTGNTRIFKDANLLHLKYGLSMMYNNLRPTDNRVFVVNGQQTDLEVYQYELDDSRFRNVYITVPLHFEFDFTKPKIKDGNKIFRTHQSVRFGIGGYSGFRLKSKQKLCFDYNGNDAHTKEKGDFNVNDFIYGVSTYLGYKQTSLYVKYDINPLFEDNDIDQNNISAGIRFDFN